MRVSAKADYGIRALVALASLQAGREGPVSRELIGDAQDIPVAFLENILLDLKRAGIVSSVRGQRGGFLLARDPERITLAEVIRVLDGPLATVRGQRPEDLVYGDDARALRDVWVALRASLRHVLEGVTVGDLVAGRLPDDLVPLLEMPDAWHGR